LKEAYLSGKIDELQKAIEEGAKSNKEGQLDQALEACKNRIELISLN
jgi:hypothetical protein